MRHKLLAGSLLGAALLLPMASPVSAHHSGHAYDRKNPVTFTGIVTQFQFANPHSLIMVDVKDKDGVLTNWVVQSAGPAKLMRAGWNRNTIKPGDTITVSGFPSKDGKKEMGLQKLTAPNGVTLTEGNE